jgi:hypothetical protein
MHFARERKVTREREREREREQWVVGDDDSFLCFCPVYVAVETFF